MSIKLTPALKEDIKNILRYDEEYIRGLSTSEKNFYVKNLLKHLTAKNEIEDLSSRIDSLKTDIEDIEINNEYTS